MDAMATIIIGGGQAGLALSRALLQRGHDHVVLEQAAGAGYAWRDQRWDSFTFVTPNHMSQLPGLESPGDGRKILEANHGKWHRWEDQIVSMSER